MMQISAREANQHFSQYLHVVEKGEEILITRHGKTVAKLIPAPAKRQLTKEQKAAWKRLRAHAKKGYDLGGLKINREELYDRSKDHN